MNASADLPSNTQSQADIAYARQVLDVEARAIQQLSLDASWHEAVELIVSRTGESNDGSLIVSGLGKSGLVGQKISATFASLGTPSQFLHPTEAVHGDLGRVRPGDVVMILSFGGQTEEVVTLATLLKQDAVPVIAMQARAESNLGRVATVNLLLGNVVEACPHQLAPTASTTAMLALGDALALTVAHRRGFGVEDYARFHPGGALGRQVMAISDAMRFRVGQNLPLCSCDLTVAQVLAEAGKVPRRAGAVLLIADDGMLTGIFTDADLRRLLLDRGAAVLDELIDQVMTRNPTTLRDTDRVRDAVQLVREKRLDEIPVVDGEGKPVGLIDVQDLMALKVVQD